MMKVHAMARTVANDPLQKFKFRVTVPGLPAGMGFQKATGLNREVGVVTYDEGGFDYTHKLSGKEKVGDVVLEVGQYANKNLEEAYKKILKDPNFRGIVTIEQFDKTGNVGRTWNLAEAWVHKWEASDLDATSEDVSIEKITIAFEYFLD